VPSADHIHLFVIGGEPAGFPPLSRLGHMLSPVLRSIEALEGTALAKAAIASTHLLHLP